MVVVPFIFACAAIHGVKPTVRSLVLLSVWLAVAAAVAAQTSTMVPTAPVTVGQQRWLLTPGQRLAIEQARRTRSASEAGEEAPPEGPWQLQGIAQPLRLGGSAWINGQLLRGGDVVSLGVRLRTIRPDRVVLERDGVLHVLRPGQVLESNGQVRDMLPPADLDKAARMSNRSTSAGDAPQR